ncbi:MOB kinase activator-like 2 [Cydia pomonella]|uniref:MOB kinase activator-like 2 n=1 Tax=Cydia pomonella TaxID=82600 RepID=UPI002ADD9844|nr:MOB kinase activator-like 2 [Cydia pomonella]
MVYVRVVFLALLATLWEVSECRYVLRRVTPCDLQPYVVSHVAYSSRYERALENIVSKLIQALVVTNVESESGGSGGASGGGGGSGSGGTGGGSEGNDGSGSPLESLLGVKVDAIGRSLLDLDVLPDSIAG